MIHSFVILEEVVIVNVLDDHGPEFWKCFNGEEISAVLCDLYVLDRTSQATR